MLRPNHDGSALQRTVGFELVTNCHQNGRLTKYATQCLHKNYMPGVSGKLPAGQIQVAKVLIGYIPCLIPFA
jgi:hypothetical protein